jgi:hypothetical protein
MKFKYSIQGEINNGIVVGRGNGSVNPIDGVSEMEVLFESLPNGWDPRTIVLCCCSRAFAMGAQEKGEARNLLSASNGFVTIGRHLPTRRRGVIHDKSGMVYADIEASSETNLRDNEAFDESRLEAGYSKLHPGISGIAEILPFSGVMMQAGPNVVNIMTNYQVRTEDGLSLYGFTFYPHYLPEQVHPILGVQRFDVEILEQQFQQNKLFLRTYATVTTIEKGAEVRTRSAGR